MLDQLLDAVRAGESRALVVRGEPGVGKTALLDYLAEQASGCRVARAAGVESEMELAFAGLHQLCAPMLDRLERLPAPQRAALRTAFGLSAGSAPDRFLVGLAILSLLAEVAEEHPLLCLVDDAQWLDQRLGAGPWRSWPAAWSAESVGLVFAARVPSDELAGLPELVVEGLREADARALLDAVLTGPLDAQVRDRIVAEAARQPAGAAGAAPGVDAGGAGGRVRPPRRDAAARGGSRRASGGGSTRCRPTPGGCCWWRRPSRSATRCCCGGRPSGSASPAQAATPAAEAGLLEVGARVRFRHPLVRSAAYRSASLPGAPGGASRAGRGHRPELDPDRRAWHRAQATPGPDEEVAAELERSAGRAQARGGLAAAAAFLERAALLTPDPGRRAQRLLAAARAKRAAGALDAALGLLVAVEAGPPDPLRTAEVEHLRGQITFVQRRAGDGCAAAPQRGQAPGAARRRPGSRDVPGGARGRDLGRRPGQPRRPAGGGRGRPRRAPRPRPAACG